MEDQDPFPLVVMGTDHRHSTLAQREALALAPGEQVSLLGRLVAAAGGAPSPIAQAVLLTAHDRVDLVMVAEDATRATGHALPLLARAAGLDPNSLADGLYILRGAEAVHHVFTTVAALDALVVGDPQLMTQMQAGQALAREAGCLGPELEALLHAAYGAARRVWRETGITAGAVSLAAAAVQIARDLHGDPERIRVLVVGGGELGEVMAQRFREAGVASIRVTGPRPAQARLTARTLGVGADSFTSLGALLAEADVVVCAVGGRHKILDHAGVRAALRARRWRPMLLIDAGVPGDVADDVDRLDEAFVYTPDDLERAAQAGRQKRDRALRGATDLLAREVNAFQRETPLRTAVPVLNQVRARLEAERIEALTAAGDDADRATRLLINRLLRDLQAVVIRDPEAEAALQRLFRLGDDPLP